MHDTTRAYAHADHPPGVQLLKVAEAGGLIGASENHVYRLVASGRLRAVDIAQPGARKSKTRIRSDDLAAFIEAATRSPKSLGRPGMSGPRTITATPEPPREPTWFDVLLALGALKAAIEELATRLEARRGDAR